MDKERIYTGLAARFVNYQNLAPIPIRECGEPMVDVTGYGLCIDLAFSQLAPSTGNKLYLRPSACERLVSVQAELNAINSGYQLVLVYAYRSMEIQKNNFEKMKIDLGYGDRTDAEAMERTHHFIAVPDVAGHPTGGAIDVLIKDRLGNVLDFGTPMHALENNSYAYSPFISNEATINRKLLRHVMQSADFAPYDGEWWHFSYGDREWAAYYNEPYAIYTQLEFTTE